MEIYENLISEKLIHITHLPIACDSFGNEILLCLDQNINYGNIFFANHEKLPLEDTYWLLSKVSTSFSDFMNLLKPMDL